MESNELTTEQKRVLVAYLHTFTSDEGKIVLDDLRKSFFERAVPDDELESHARLVKRVTEQGVYLKIVRMMERAADAIQTAEGVKPARTPSVESDAEDIYFK